MITKNASIAATIAVLGGLIFWAGFRERTGAARPPRPTRPAAATARAEPVVAGTASEADPFVVAARDVAADLRRLQDRRQREWALEVDRQTRLEWMEQYDAERKALLQRLEPLLAGRPRSVLDDFDTWAASQREYGKP